MWQKVFICFCCCFENIISALNHIRYLSFKMLSFSLLSHLWPFVANTYPELDQGRSLGLVWDPCMYLRLFPSSLPLTQDYCASKFGVVGFHESLSHELKAAEKDGIKTTLVCPYLVDTGMFRGCRIRSVKPILLLIKSCFKSHRCIAGEYVSEVFNVASLVLSLSLARERIVFVGQHSCDWLASERLGPPSCQPAEASVRVQGENRNTWRFPQKLFLWEFISL